MALRQLLAAAFFGGRQSPASRCRCRMHSKGAVAVVVLSHPPQLCQLAVLPLIGALVLGRCLDARYRRGSHERCMDARQWMGLRERCMDARPWMGLHERWMGVTQ